MPERSETVRPGTHAPQPAAVLETLVAQHTENRAMVAKLFAMLEQLPRESTGRQSTFVVAARRYIASVRDHFRMENDGFPGSARNRAAAADDSLCRQFAMNRGRRHHEESDKGNPLPRPQCRAASRRLQVAGQRFGS
jgi:hemerythrin-like domain-containing protein